MASSSVNKTEQKGKEGATAAAPTTPAPPVVKDIFSELKSNVLEVEKTGLTKEGRFLRRALRNLKSLRKKLTAHNLTVTLTAAFPKEQDPSSNPTGDSAVLVSQRAELLKVLKGLVDPPAASSSAMEVEGTNAAPTQTPSTTTTPPTSSGSFLRSLNPFIPSSSATSSATAAAAAQAASVAKEGTTNTTTNNNNNSNNNTTPSSPTPAATSQAANPISYGQAPVEVITYFQLLTLILLIDRKEYKTAAALSSSLISSPGGNAGNALTSFTRRTLSPLSCKLWFYFSRANELLSDAAYSDIRPTLLAALRTSTLRHDDEAQVTILNLLLRSYVHFNLYEQADKLVSTTSVKEGTISNNQYARYLYYQGRIKAIQLEYEDAEKLLLQATRKAPQYSAHGFRLTVHKLGCIVKLLEGDIPERNMFATKGLKKGLKAYFELTKSVYVGDLKQFNHVLQSHKSTFVNDNNLSLIQRLHHNVIKTGLKSIALSYSKISFEDISKKLHLDDTQKDSVEFIVAKAIKDNVISAVIHHDKQFVSSKELVDLYSSQEPASQFHKRVDVLINIHNDSVKAMRFHPSSANTSAENEEARKERQRSEQEIANTLAKDTDDDF